MPPKKKARKRKSDDISVADEMIGTDSSTSDTPKKKKTKKTVSKKSATKKKKTKKSIKKTTKKKAKKKKAVEEAPVLSADTIIGAHDVEEHDAVVDEEKMHASNEDVDEESPEEVLPEIDNENDTVVETEELEEDEEDEESPEPSKKDVRSNFVASKKSIEHIDEQLTEIYKNGDGSLPDMGHFQTKKRHRFFRAFFLFLITCVFLGAVAWVGFFVLQPRTSFSEEDVILSISGEETVVLGQEIRYRLRYRNAQGVPLSQAQLQIRYPEGFVYVDSSEPPIDESNDTWALGTIDANESGYIDIYGTLYGDVGEAQSFRVFLNYLPANFSSEFQKVATASIEVTDAPVALFIEAPDTIIPGVESTFDIIVQTQEDRGDVVMNTVAVEIDPGEGFLKKSSSIDSDQFYDYRWSITPGEDDIRIQVTGTFIVDEEDDTVNLPIRILGWDSGSTDGEGYVYAEKILEAVVVRQAISVTPVVNGATSELTVQPGEVLNASLVVRNNGDTALQNVEVRAVFDAPSYERRSILKWSEVGDEYDGDIFGEQLNEQTRRGTISWDSSHLAGLRSIGPGEEVTFDVRLPIQSNNDTALKNFVKDSLTLVGEIRYTVGGEPEVLSSAPVTMTLNSDISLEIRDEKGETDDGKEMHTIVWLLENTFHELTDITVTADVFGDTTFVEEELVTPAGDVTYDADLGKITWTVDTMPTSVDVLPLQFVLVRNESNPSQSQLVSKVQLRATDSVTGEQLILVGDETLLVAE